MYYLREPDHAKLVSRLFKIKFRPDFVQIKLYFSKKEKGDRKQVLDTRNNNNDNDIKIEEKTTAFSSLTS